MKTPIDIISGFLGAGKTTLLNKMLKSVYKDKRIAIIENEFGDVNIDVDILPNDISITEMTNGCACCTIRAGLIDAIQHLISLDRFDRIIIEPSGVANVSDVQSVIGTKALKDIAMHGISIAVVNPIFHINYSNTLGICYHDQIENSDIIFLNRIDEAEDTVIAKIVSDLSEKNKGKIITKISEDILDFEVEYHGNKEVMNSHHDEHHHDGHACHHHHDDSAKDFDSYTKEFLTKIDKSQIANIIEEIVDKSKNRVLRMKGVIQTFDGPKLIQWIPGELNISEFDSHKNSIVIIEHK